MKLIDIPFAGGKDEVIVDETAGTFSVEVKAQILGTDQDVKLKFPIKVILLSLLGSVQGTVLRFILGILINLFA